MSKLPLQSFDIVGKRKIWFIVPIVVIAIAILAGVIYGATLNEPFNLSMDFSGGYTVTVKLGMSLNDDTKADYEKQISDVFEGLSGEDGQSYGLVASKFTLQNEKADRALRVQYSAVASEAEMKDINNELKEALQLALFPNDPYGGGVSDGSRVSASVSSELLISALCAILLAIVLMLIYIAVRFELLDGIASIICLMHDLAIMVAFMVICHIPISSTFIAAMITILGYSINNTIIIFDRIRSIKKQPDADQMSASQIANNAVKSTLVRTINTTSTTFITVAMVCLMSLCFFVEDMIFFCLPLIIGLIAGTFSSVFITPSIWAMWKERSARLEDKKPSKSGDGEGLAQSIDDNSSSAESVDVQATETAELISASESNL